MTIQNGLAAIVERLKAIEKIFSEYRGAIHTAQERDRELESRQQSIRAEITFDDGTKREVQTEANRQHSVQNSIRWAAWCAFAAAFIYAWLAAFQLREMRKATNAAQASAEVARDTLILAQRPWVGIDGIPTIKQNDRGVWLAELHIRNYGLSPGLHSVPTAERVLAPFSGDLAGMEKLECEEGEGLTTGRLGVAPGRVAQNGYTIFPGPTSLKIRETIGNPGSSATIYGCITYMDEFAKPGDKTVTIHHTPYCYFARQPFRAGKETEACFAGLPAD